MRKIIILFLLFAVMACGGSGGSSDTSNFYIAKIEDWQAREAVAPDIVTACSYTGDLISDIIYILNQKIIGFEFIPDPDGGDYWQTSGESLLIMRGDCEDTAILAYRILSDSCLPNYYENIIFRIRVYDRADLLDHSVMIVYYDSKSWEIDNLMPFIGESDLPIIREFDSESIFF